MTRKERACRALPTWALERMVASALMKSWWTVAWLEMWRREVEEEIAVAADLESGPWPCVMPRGVH